MTRARRRLPVAALLVLVFWLSAASPVLADLPEPDLFVGFESQAAVGETIAIAAYLSDPADNPIAGAEIVFFAEISFMNASDDVEIGLAITDQTGLALLSYVLRMEGERSVKARFAGNQVFAPAEDSRTIVVASGPQLHRELSPIRVPGANVQMAAAILSAVWVAFLFALWQVWRIARVGEDLSGGGDA